MMNVSKMHSNFYVETLFRRFFVSGVLGITFLFFAPAVLADTLPDSTTFSEPLTTTTLLDTNATTTPTPDVIVNTNAGAPGGSIETPMAAVPPIIQAIRAAKPQLTTLAAQHKTAKISPRVVTSKNAPLKFTLAVWDSASTPDAITLVTGTKQGNNLKPDVELPYTLKIAKTTQGTMRWQASAPGLVVVGILAEEVVQTNTSKKKPTYEVRPSYVVSRAPEVFTPAVYAAGSDYLSDLIAGAYRELRANNVRSRAYPNKLVADVIDPYVVKSIIVSEHTSHLTLLKGQEEGTMEAFLVTLAIASDDAFGSSLSGAGAAGLAQFIPSTYKLVVQKMPEYELNPDFKKGMADHHNAIKAQIGLLDLNLDAIPAAKVALKNNDQETTGALLAAAYNGGAGRVKKAVELWGDNWDEGRASSAVKFQSEAAAQLKKINSLKAQIKKATGKKKTDLQSQLNTVTAQRNANLHKIKNLQTGTLRSETVVYVQKLRKAYAMFSSGMYATPYAPSGGLPIIALGSTTSPKVL